MLERIASAIVGIALLGYIINAGGWLFWGGICLLNILALNEIRNAFKRCNINIAFGHLSVFTIMLFYFIKIIPNHNFTILLPPVLLIIFLFSYSIINNNHYRIQDIAFNVFSYVYTSGLFLHFILMRNLRDGVYFMWWIFITNWACDTGAFFTGLIFGKNKLAPAISPHKTIEGSIGGILFSVFASFLYIKFILPEIKIVDSLILGFLVGIFSQMGDLSASLIKRYCSIKDFSRIIPGHGGILDRFDSTLFSLPIAYYYIMWFIQGSGGIK